MIPAPIRGAVLVTGAAGGLGMRLCERLLHDGFAVRSLVLPDDPQQLQLARLGCEVWEADVCDPASLVGVCRGIDTAIHLAAVVVSHDAALFRRVNRDGTAHLLAAADAERVRHFIYVSSASVTYPTRTPYAQSKFEAEQLVAGRKGAYTIVRPTLVYDEHGGHELRMFLDYLRRFPVVPFIGAGRALKRPVHAQDVISALASLCAAVTPPGKTYNLSGGEAIRMLDFARLLLHQHAAQRPIVRLPVALWRVVAWVMAACMPRPPLTPSAIAGVVNDADLDPSEAMRDLDYRPIGVREGIQRCFPRAAAAFNASKSKGVES